MVTEVIIISMNKTCSCEIYICTHTWSVQKVSSHVICKIETFTEEDIRYKNHYTKDNDASVPSNEAPWDLTQ